MGKPCFCCKKVYDDHLSLTCSVCQHLYGNSCVGMSSSEVRIINSKKSISWNCSKCESIGSDIMSLKSIIVSLQKEISELRSSIATSSQTVKIQDESFEEIVQELEDRMQRRNNIMLYGLAEPSQDIAAEVRAQTDIKSVEEALKFVNPDVQLDIKKVFRVGKSYASTGKPRPLKITLNSDAPVRQLLSRSGQLKKYRKHPNLFLSSDCTPRQNEYFKRVKAEFERRKNDGESVQMRFVRGVPTIKPLN